MAEFPSKVSTRTSSPAQGAGASVSSLRPDLGFVRSSLGALMLLQLVSARGAARGVLAGPGGIGGSGRPSFAPRTPAAQAHTRLDAPCLPRGLLQDRCPGDHPGTLSPRESLSRSVLTNTLAVRRCSEPTPTPLHPLRWSPEAPRRKSRMSHRLTSADSLLDVPTALGALGLCVPLCLCTDSAPALQRTQPRAKSTLG